MAESEDCQGQLSRDGRLAFTLGQVRRSPTSTSAALMAAKVRVSRNGGSDPRWSVDGRELFYLDDSGRLIAVPFPKADLTFGTQTPLFATGTTPPASPYLTQYAVGRNAQRFLVKVPVERLESLPITVVMDWTRRLTSPQ